MYVRFNTSPKTKNPIVQIVESYRDAGKVKQRIVASFGVAKSKEDLDRLQVLAQDMLTKIQTERLKGELKTSLFPAHDESEISVSASKESDKSAMVDAKFLTHRATIFDGFDRVVSALLESSGFAEILANIKGKQEFSLVDIVRLYTAQMFDDPASKMRCFQRQNKHGFSGIKLHDIYRAMDKLLTLESSIQAQAYKIHGSSIFKEDVDCLFVDVTTLFFESVSQDDLRDFGYSKDQKSHSVQIVLCLAVNKEGLPLGYEIFRGNTAETKTFIPAIKNMRNRFNVTSATIVCDRGLASLENITELENSGLTFIFATKIKHLPSKLDLSNLKTFTSEFNDENEKIIFKIVDHPKYPNASLLVTYSESRAKKDKADRDRLIHRLETKMLGKESDPKISKLVSNSGYKKFAVMTGEAKWSINDDAVIKAAMWDGFHGISFSKKLNLSAQEVLRNYRGLWRVEEAFRIAKKTLEIRPMYHWKPRRIKAHVLLCFIGLFCERFLELKLRSAQSPLTPDRIRSALQSIHSVQLADSRSNRDITVPSVLSNDAKSIFRVLKLPLRRKTKVEI